MKRFVSIFFVISFVLLSSGCVSRTTNRERGYGSDTTDTQLIWFWQKDFKKPR